MQREAVGGGEMQQMMMKSTQTATSGRVSIVTSLDYVSNVFSNIINNQWKNNL